MFASADDYADHDKRPTTPTPWTRPSSTTRTPTPTRTRADIDVNDDDESDDDDDDDDDERSTATIESDEEPSPPPKTRSSSSKKTKTSEIVRPSLRASPNRGRPSTSASRDRPVTRASLRGIGYREDVRHLFDSMPSHAFPSFARVAKETRTPPNSLRTSFLR